PQLRCRRSVAPPALHSFPTRRSSDLVIDGDGAQLYRELAFLGPGYLTDVVGQARQANGLAGEDGHGRLGLDDTIGHRLVMCREGDRKSTRLNSSHVSISYAVFCLKNK